MGKLHTLRRAIKRNPEIWIDNININGKYVVKSAIFHEGQWVPFSANIHGWNPKKINMKSSDDPFKSYRKYVKSVLISIGYDAVGDF